MIGPNPGGLGGKFSDIKKPDLIVQSLTDDGAKPYGHPWYMLKNIGEANSVPCKNILYMDGYERAVDIIDVIIPPGVEIARVINSLDYTIAVENHRWELKADADNKNDESNENNNTAVIDAKWK
jgi:hypothetical protein